MGQHESHTVSFHALVRGVESQWQQPSQPRQDAMPEPDDGVEQVAPATASTTPTAAHKLVTLLEQVREQVACMHAARASNLHELQELAIELGVMVASHIVKEKLDAKDLNLAELVQTAVAQLLPTERITVRLHPQDDSDLTTLTESGLGGFREQIEVVHDEDLPRGTCLVVGDDHGLLSSLESRLEAVRETLMQGIEYARIERRKPSDTGAALWRFPDRRKLA